MSGNTLSRDTHSRDTRPSVTRADVLASAERISATVHRTPVATCQTLDKLAGRSLFFKCEHLQKVGAFKFRGALNAVMQLDPETAANGVVTHSSGNHAQALALAAQLKGVPAHVVMPSNATPAKLRAVIGYGGQVIECEPTLPARESTAEQVRVSTGATMIPPFNHPDVIAGQGTATLEFLEQVSDLDAIIAPIGGGGLISGSCAAIQGLASPPRIYAAEPCQADDAFRSKQGGVLVPQLNPQTVADGLLTGLGDLTWPFVRDHVEQVITVSEEEIVSAMRLCWERAKLLIEPSSAVAVAVALSDAFQKQERGQRVGVILSGGNVNIDNLPW